MNFNKLSEASKLRAVMDYIKGWEETHLFGDISTDEVYVILDEYKFNEDGSLYDGKAFDLSDDIARRIVYRYFL